MSSSNQRPANRGFRSVFRCAIFYYRQFPWLSAPEPGDGDVAGVGLADHRYPGLSHLRIQALSLSVLLQVARSRSTLAAATGKTSSGSSWIVTLGQTARAISHRWR